MDTARVDVDFSSLYSNLKFKLFRTVIVICAVVTIFDIWVFNGTLTNFRPIVDSITIVMLGAIVITCLHKQQARKCFSPELMMIWLITPFLGLYCYISIFNSQIYRSAPTEGDFAVYTDVHGEYRCARMSPDSEFVSKSPFERLETVFRLQPATVNLGKSRSIVVNYTIKPGFESQAYLDYGTGQQLNDLVEYQVRELAKTSKAPLTKDKVFNGLDLEMQELIKVISVEDKTVT